MVLSDPDDPWVADSLLPSVCAGSVIDVQFKAEGQFNKYNDFSLQMTKQNGTPLSPNGVIGVLYNYNSTDTATIQAKLYDNVEAGCNYYLRVRSSTPYFISESWGPFCIRNCDLSILGDGDNQICLVNGEGFETELSFKINSWNTTSNSYSSDNTFSLEIRNAVTFELANNNYWGFKSNQSDTVSFLFPDVLELKNKGINPNNYFMRLVADGSDNPKDKWSNWVRLNIGALQDESISISSDKSFLCKNDKLLLFVDNLEKNKETIYRWFFSDGLVVYDEGTPNPLQLSVSFLEGDYTIYLEEESFGCTRASDTIAIKILPTEPSSNIIGSTYLCIGQAAWYSYEPFPNSSYNWSVTGATIWAQDYNEVLIVSEYENFAINLNLETPCFEYETKKIIQTTSIKMPTIYQGIEDTVICQNDSLELFVLTDAEEVIWKEGEKVLAKNLAYIMVYPEKTTVYTLILNAGHPCQVDKEITVVVKGCNTTSYTSNVEHYMDNVYIFPNPTKNKTTKLFYTLKDKSYHVKFCLYDLSGRKVMEQVLPFAQNSLTLNLSEQANAMYLFTLETEEGSILKSGKLINR